MILRYLIFCWSAFHPEPCQGGGKWGKCPGVAKIVTLYRAANVKYLYLIGGGQILLPWGTNECQHGIAFTHNYSLLFYLSQ